MNWRWVYEALILRNCWIIPAFGSLEIFLFQETNLSKVQAKKYASLIKLREWWQWSERWEKRMVADPKLHFRQISLREWRIQKLIPLKFSAPPPTRLDSLCILRGGIHIRLNAPPPRALGTVWWTRAVPRKNTFPELLLWLKNCFWMFPRWYMWHFAICFLTTQLGKVHNCVSSEQPHCTSQRAPFVHAQILNKKVMLRRSLVVQQLRTQLVSMRTRFRSLASLSGLGIWRCHVLWCSSQMWLGSDGAVAVALIQPLAWEFPYAWVQP